MAIRVRALGARAVGASQWMWARERRWIALLAAAVAALATFLEISDELFEGGDLLAFDRALLRAMAALRLPWLTIVAIDITALGSLTLLALMMACSAVSLLLMRDLSGALQLCLAMGGVGFWTFVTKHLFARERPELAYRLIEVPGYSFPSGHSAGAAALYVTLAMVLGRHVRSVRGRTWLVSCTSTMALLIGLSRVYLGVHYPTDVASGLAFGASWALFLTALFEWHRYARRRSGAQSMAATESAREVGSAP